jgi:predicted acyltransferase
MSLVACLPSTTAATEFRAPRIVSIDVFRGLTMAVMIFVNALAEVPGLPWWTYHAHTSDDLMTYVDMVFPSFLFIVGMSMPLSIAQRLKRNPSPLSLWAHVVVRVLGLLGLGLILANADLCDSARMRIDGYLWAFLALLSAALYLNVYPKSTRFPAYSHVLRALGLAGVVVLFALFRRTTPSGHVAWIDFSYPEILGLIGISYLAAAILYIPCRRWRWTPAAWFVLMMAMCALMTAHKLAFLDRLPFYFWPFGNGSLAGIVMAGALTSSLFLSPGAKLPWRRAMAIAVGFALLVFAAGWMLSPLGISKNRATPTWSLYSIGASILIFALLYWICDVKQWKRWAFFVHPAGANTLTTYLLPDLWEFVTGALGLTFYSAHFVMGWPAVVKTFAFTFFILAVSGVLTKAKIRLQF